MLFWNKSWNRILFKGTGHLILHEFRSCRALKIFFPPAPSPPRTNWPRIVWIIRPMEPTSAFLGINTSSFIKPAEPWASRWLGWIPRRIGIGCWGIGIGFFKRQGWTAVTAVTLRFPLVRSWDFGPHMKQHSTGVVSACPEAGREASSVFGRFWNTAPNFCSARQPM